MLHSPAWELWWLAAMPVLGNLRFSWTIQICQGAYMQLVCVYFTQTWLCGVLLTNHGLLAYTSVLDWYRSKIWLPVIDWPALIAHLIPKSDQSHNIYLKCFFILMNFCHLSLLEARLHACWNQAVRRDWPAWKTKLRQWKATVQKLLLGKSRYFIQLQISKAQAQSLGWF